MTWNKKTETATTTTTTVSKPGSTTTTEHKTTTTSFYESFFGVVRPRPQDDLYAHVNCEWLNDPSAAIPPEHSTWGALIALRDESAKNQIVLLNEISAKTERTPEEEKLCAIWSASLKRFEEWENGTGSYSPITEGLATIDEHLDGDDEKLAAYLALSRKLGYATPFYFYSLASVQDSKNEVLNLHPYGLSLPSRDYYFDEKFEGKRAWFLDHLKRVAELVGEDKLVPGFAEAVVRFETKLAYIQMKSHQQRERSKYYTVTTLDEIASGINTLASLEDKLSNYTEEEKYVTLDDTSRERIAAFLDNLIASLNVREALDANYVQNYPDGTDNHYRVIVHDGDYFRRVFTILFAEENREDLKAYLQYQLIIGASKFATRALDEEVFDFQNRKLGGQKEQQSYEKRSVELVNSWAGFLLGQVYVGRFFSLNDKQRVHDMIIEVTDVMSESIKNNDWLTEQTKEAALAKLARFTPKIGFPDKWESYDKLVINSELSLWEINKAVKMFIYDTKFLEKVNGPVDSNRWFMSPQTVSAYFNPLQNEIVFPAAIIQPPFYSSTIEKVAFKLNEADRALVGDDEIVLDAVNFGGIAAVIAHEITHGFDDQGRKFDKNGNMNDWWSEKDAALFQAKCDLMAKQPWSFTEPATGKVHHMNHKLTMGENLADLGGISLAVQSLARRIEKRFGSDVAKRNALFRILFSSWSVIWQFKGTDEAIISRIATDPHAPGPYRCNLAKNIQQFYEAFDVKEGDKMYIPPEDRVVMW
ncbi:hypothetical protein HDU79_008608 [Rhizoclosmatium sp. JEL0117]|nr:hypothetical protein HDU79_008608 [Rhizoclosmatium sp. JEL0117]